MRNDLIRAVLDCGVDDLSLLDDAGANIYETVNRIKEEGQEISLMSITEEIFKEGIFRMSEAVKQECKRLEYVARCGRLTAEGKEKLEAIRNNNLSPQQDFEYYLNFLDTHLYCDSNKKAIYEEWFEAEMLALMDYTGFDIEG